MHTLPTDVSEFLSKFNLANRRRGTVRGFPASLYTVFRFAPDLGLYEIASGHEISGGYDGEHEAEALYLQEPAFLEIAKALMASGRVVVATEAIRVSEGGSWDHSYGHPSDSSGATVARGRVDGSIELRENVVDSWSLRFSPTGETRSFQDDCKSSIDRAVITAAILELRW